MASDCIMSLKMFIESLAYNHLPSLESFRILMMIRKMHLISKLIYGSTHQESSIGLIEFCCLQSQCKAAKPNRS